MKNNAAIQKENAESTLIKPIKNDEFTLAEDITEYYISKPSTESDTIITKEILRINSASIPKYNDGEKQYYKITYNSKEGWIKTDDPKITKISAFNWEEFGFKAMDAGDEYCYSVKDVKNNIETSPFLEKIWKTIDENNDNIIDENEWNRAKNAKVLSQFSKLVCKHKSEWSYTESEIEKEIKEYYKIGLNQATGDKKKTLEAKQDENIALLKKRVKNTCFWDKVEKGEQENKNSFSNLTAGAFLAIIVYSYYTKDEKKEADKKNIRNFKTSQKNVWHFHPIAFVEHMKLITDKYKPDHGDIHDPVVNPQVRGWYYQYSAINKNSSIKGWNPYASRYIHTHVTNEEVKKYGKPQRSTGGHGGLDIYAPVGTPISNKFRFFNNYKNSSKVKNDGWVNYNDLGSSYTDPMVSETYKVNYNSSILQIDNNVIDINLIVNTINSKFDSDNYVKVKKGQIIGYTGSTGNSYQGKSKNHLHFGIKNSKGNRVSPYELLENYINLDASGLETSSKQDGVKPSGQW